MSSYGIVFEAPAGAPFDPEHAPFHVGDVIDIPHADGPERARVEYVEWFPNGGASVYVELTPVSR